VSYPFRPAQQGPYGEGGSEVTKESTTSHGESILELPERRRCINESKLNSVVSGYSGMSAAWGEMRENSFFSAVSRKERLMARPHFHFRLRFTCLASLGPFSAE